MSDYDYTIFSQKFQLKKPYIEGFSINCIISSPEIVSLSSNKSAITLGIMDTLSGGSQCCRRTANFFIIDIVDIGAYPHRHEREKSNFPPENQNIEVKQGDEKEDKSAHTSLFSKFRFREYSI